MLYKIYAREKNLSIAHIYPYTYLTLNLLVWALATEIGKAHEVELQFEDLAEQGYVGQSSSIGKPRRKPAA